MRCMSKKGKRRMLHCLESNIKDGDFKRLAACLIAVQTPTPHSLVDAGEVILNREFHLVAMKCESFLR